MIHGINDLVKDKPYSSKNIEIIPRKSDNKLQAEYKRN